MTETKNVYAAPAADLDNSQVDNTATLASRWARLGASILDALIIMPVSMLFVYLTVGFAGLMGGAQLDIGSQLVGNLIGLVVFAALHGWLLVNRGQTIGKKLLGIKIVSVDGSKPEVPTLLKRYGFYLLVPMVPVVGPLIAFINILFIFSAKKQCLHDRVADTIVVKV